MNKLRFDGLNQLEYLTEISKIMSLGVFETAVIMDHRAVFRLSCQRVVECGLVYKK